MKFSIALAGILTQTLSSSNARQVEGGTKILNGLSAAGTGSFKQQRPLRRLVGSRNSNNYGRPVLSRRLNNQKNDLPLRNLYSLSSVDGGKPCDPSALDPDVGILSCGKGSLCKPDTNSFLGGTRVDAPGILKNKPQQKVFSTGYDPASTDTADVGVLVCGEGQRCVPSAASGMGGYCESSSMEEADASSRELFSALMERGICNSSHPDYMYYDCDCSGYDIMTGSGSIACNTTEFCLGLSYNGCKDVCFEREAIYTFDNFKSPGYSQCVWTTDQAPTPQEVCITESFDDHSCEISLYDQECSICNVTVLPPSYPRYYTAVNFDCRNVEGGSYGYLTTFNLLPIIGECYEPIENPVPCEICPGVNSGINMLSAETLQRTRVNVDGYGTFSCDYLAIWAYIYPSLGQDACSAVVAAMDPSCCSPICDICDDVASTNFAAVANFSGYGEVYCYYLMGLLADPTQCAEAKPLLVDACCGLAVSTSGPSTGDGEAATPGPTGDQGSTPPTIVGDDSDANVDGETTPPPTKANIPDTAVDGAYRVSLSTWSALMMIGSAGALMAYFAI